MPNKNERFPSLAYPLFYYPGVNTRVFSNGHEVYGRYLLEIPIHSEETLNPAKGLCDLSLNFVLMRSQRYDSADLTMLGVLWEYDFDYCTIAGLIGHSF